MIVEECVFAFMTTIIVEHQPTEESPYALCCGEATPVVSRGRRRSNDGGEKWPLATTECSDVDAPSVRLAFPTNSASISNNAN